MSAPPCFFLRSRGAYGRAMGSDDDWHSGDSPVVGYWCLATMEAAGPDDGLAHPHGCRSGRPCWREPAAEG